MSIGRSKEEQRRMRLPYDQLSQHKVFPHIFDR